MNSAPQRFYQQQWAKAPRNTKTQCKVTEKGCGALEKRDEPAEKTRHDPPCTAIWGTSPPNRKKVRTDKPQNRNRTETPKPVPNRNPFLRFGPPNCKKSGTGTAKPLNRTGKVARTGSGPNTLPNTVWFRSKTEETEKKGNLTKLKKPETDSIG